MIVFKPPPPAGCYDQHESDLGVARAECTVVAVHRTAAMGRPNAERAVVQPTLVAADDPAAIGLDEDIDAESDELNGNTVVRGKRANQAATLPEAVGAFCDRVRKFVETRFGFARRRREIASEQAATPVAVGHHPTP